MKKAKLEATSRRKAEAFGWRRPKTAICTVAVVLLAFIAVALSAAQQSAGTPPAHPEIRGLVLEPETNQPVVDAEISLFVQQPGPVRINGGWKRDDARKARTDDSGAFALSLEKLGPYRVETKKPGYAAADASGASDYAEVTLTAQTPTAEVKLFLVRPGQLTGSVIDGDTGEPVANLRLSAVRKRNSLGFFWPGDGTPARTDAEGKFVATGLQPGEYAVEVGPQAEPDKRVLTKFTDKDVSAVAVDYERTYWPGGHGQEDVSPVMLVSGATVNIGVLTVKKLPYYSVHVRIPVSNCEPGDTMQVSESVETGRGHSFHSLPSPPCGEDLLVTGFSPGMYRLILSLTGRTRETRGTASVPFSIVDRNIEVIAPLAPGVAVDGVFLAAEGAKLPDLTKTKISLGAMDGTGFMGEGLPVPAGPEGKFRIEGVRLVDQSVRISGLGPGNYVKEIRYNGGTVLRDIVTLDSGAMAHTLTIVIDDKPGTIIGTVMSGDKPVSRPFVIARKWPPPDGPTLSSWGMAGAKGDDAGRFRIAGLAPGEYHVIAARSIDFATSNAVVERALLAAEKIEVGPNGLQNVTLEVTDLR